MCAVMQVGASVRARKIKDVVRVFYARTVLICVYVWECVKSVFTVDCWTSLRHRLFTLKSLYEIKTNDLNESKRQRV